MIDLSRFKFVPLEEGHLTIIRNWLEAVHMREWWGDPDEAFEEIRLALAEPSTDPYLVTFDARPLGYLQLYRIHQEEDHPYKDQPLLTAGIDQSIGEAENLGQGLGSAFIRRFADKCFVQGYTRIVTDPDPRNARAVRAYEKAGFQKIEERDTPFGHVLLMARNAPDRMNP